MKKFFAFMLIICTLLSISACTSQKKTITSPVTYYYVQQQVDYSKPDNLIVPYIAESAGHEGDYKYLVGEYIATPPDAKFVSPFPVGTILEELRLENNRVQIVLSSQMAELSGVSMMVAFACLTKTVVGMTGIQTVQIQITDNLINGEESISLSPNSFSYWDSVTADGVAP